MSAALGATVNLPAVLIANGLGVWLTAILLRDTRPHLRRIRREIRTFRTMCRLCLTLCLLETLGFCLDGPRFAALRSFCLLLNAVVFGLNAVFAYLWLYYIGHKLFEPHPHLRYVDTVAAIPAGLVVVLCAANLFTEVFFGITADNVYYRGVASPLVYAVTYLYLLAGGGLALYHRLRVDRSRSIPVFTFLLPVFIGTIIQYLWYGLAAIWVSVAVGLTALHTTLQREESSLDALTGAHNRNYLIYYRNYAITLFQQGRRLSGLMLDVNGFKQINDTYGHRAGDRVLYAVARILKQAAGPRAIVTRYGGDEFVILVEDASLADLQTVQHRIQAALDAYNAAGEGPCPVTVSMGAAELGPNGLSELFDKMDRAMYQDKQAFYRRQGIDRRHHDLPPSRSGKEQTDR